MGGVEKSACCTLRTQTWSSEGPVEGSVVPMRRGLKAEGEGRTQVRWDW